MQWEIIEARLYRMKVAIVTGAAQGIGRRTSEVLAGAGYELLLLDVQSCAAALASIRAVGADAEQVLGDIRDEPLVARAVKQCGSAGAGPIYW